MLFIPFSGPVPHTKNALLLFLGSDTPDWTEIGERFKRWTAANVVPPRLFVLANLEAAKKLKDDFEAVGGSGTSIQVVSRLCDVWLFSYTGNGDISHVAEQNRLQIQGLDDLVVPAVDSLIKRELLAGGLVAAAPQGFYFSKLSSRNSSHFIRAESLLSCTASIELLAVRLLKSFRDYCNALPEVKVRILVDSMVIWPVAQALVSMRREKDAKRRYVIESFRSYDGLSDDSIEPGPAFVLISASTSGGLEQHLLERLGRKDVECYTVLGLESKVALNDDERKERQRKIIYTLPRHLTGPASLEGLRPLFETDVSEVPPGCESVRIIGERFLNQNFKPKPVRLAHKALEDGRKTTLAQLSADKLVLVARRRQERMFWSLSFDIERLVNKYCIDDVSGECLLRSWLINYAAAGNMVVVYPADVLESGRPGEGEAKRMAMRTRDLLLEKSPGAEVRLVNSKDLERPSEELKSFIVHAGVVIVAPILGNGFTFKRVSAALRAIQPKGPRLYIALTVLAESQARLNELRTDLQMNGDESAYHFKAAIQLAIGKIDQDIDWHGESQLVSRVLTACGEDGVPVPPFLVGRLKDFRAGNGLNGSVALMPSYSGQPPAMSPGFLLWRSKATLSGHELNAGVFLTVAVFLEACRTAASKDSDTSLISGLFQQTLIAPANFTRFNDPAIQAALLRAAYKSELNFSSSPDLSSDMQRLVMRLIDLYDAPAGEALPEFLLALAMGRLTLAREHMKELLPEAAKLPGWLRYLAEELPGWSAVKDEASVNVA
ncbi:hypothetical protein [Paraburkholderia metrosideri]|uniref:SIR2-like domain-containing protein n=1 Tax=Paraburkholderia metrosideri TaxID=580937 RepID=A0ABN7HV28_9BURK|nr:hypothetical protein [Paraburkholderia metrosideri]CAD6539306.1 hypothetical protein LMG28140_03357 [Paraburkholderia metrosideri]